jgi:hypothetical protein
LISNQSNADRRANNIKIKYFYLISTIILGIYSCGIDEIYYLSQNPLSIYNDSTSFILSIKKPDPDDQSYLGVQLFYKIYASLDDADIDRSYISAKQSETNSVPGNLIETYLISTSGLGYMSPVVNNSIKIPFILKSAVTDENDFINVTFTSTTDQPGFYFNHDYINHVVTTFYTLKRSVIDDTQGGEYKTFLAKPVAGDSDYRSRIDDDDSTYFIQFYAAAYGLDLSSFEDLYGSAIYLGTMTVEY